MPGRQQSFYSFFFLLITITISPLVIIITIRVFYLQYMKDESEKIPQNMQRRTAAALFLFKDFWFLLYKYAMCFSCLFTLYAQYSQLNGKIAMQQSFFM